MDSAPVWYENVNERSISSAKFGWCLLCIRRSRRWLLYNDLMRAKREASHECIGSYFRLADRDRMLLFHCGKRWNVAVARFILATTCDDQSVFQFDLPSRCAVVLVCVGLLLKTALFPLHFWLASVPRLWCLKPGIRLSSRYCFSQLIMHLPKLRCFWASGSLRQNCEVAGNGGWCSGPCRGSIVAGRPPIDLRIGGKDRIKILRSYDIRALVDRAQVVAATDRTDDHAIGFSFLVSRLAKSPAIGSRALFIDTCDGNSMEPPGVWSCNVVHCVT